MCKKNQEVNLLKPNMKVGNMFTSAECCSGGLELLIGKIGPDTGQKPISL